MDLKQGSLYTILVLGGIGLLAVSCSDPDNNVGHHGDKMEHGKTGYHETEGSHAPVKLGHTADGASSHESASDEACVGFGPQTPRDIDNLGGENKRMFSVAAAPTEMNLCNIHFHENAEHKAKAFSVYAGDGSGYQCGISKELSKAELAPTQGAICQGEHGGLVPGDTIEVHWVHTSADITPGPTLGACLNDSIMNPSLRVEAQVFTLVNDPKALDFNDLDYDGNMVNGYHQPKALPTNTGKPIEFLGSATGPKYSQVQCSSLQVTWSVRPQCAKLDINSVGKWCEDNAFDEGHAHGVRKRVTHPKLLSEIKQ